MVVIVYGNRVYNSSYRNHGKKYCPDFFWGLSFMLRENWGFQAGGKVYCFHDFNLKDLPSQKLT